MKTLFFNLILFLVGLLPTMILQAQNQQPVDPNIIKSVKQYADLKAANNDTLNFLVLNYTNTYKMKPLKQFFADIEADGFSVRSCILSDYPVGTINLYCFLEPVNRMKEICANGSKIYWFNVILAYDLRPDTRFEECRVVYDKLVKFGLNKLYPLSKELLDLIKNINVDFINVSYESIDYLKEQIEHQ